MRTAITLARKHGEKNFVVVAGTETPIHEQIAAFKKGVAESGKTHPVFDQVEIWTSSEGRIKHIKFSKPEKPTPPPPMPPVIVDEQPPASDPTSETSTEEQPVDAKAPPTTAPRRRTR